MTIRELTDDEKDRLLSQSEVDELDDGDEVMVKWNGGNGPHRYVIGWVDGEEHPRTRDTRTGEITGPPLDYVGERPRQRVFYPDESG